jgi:FkbM family methyltransferase
LDIIGEVLRATGSFSFPAKGRLIRYWMQHRNLKDRRLRQLTTNASVLCDFSIPYEAMVWLRQEEEHELTVLGKLLRPGQVFIDCGANIGLWSIVAANAVASQGRVLAFEPNPKTAEKLRCNLSRSHIDNVKVTEAALSNKTGNVLLQAEDAHNQAMVVASASENTIIVPTTTLDSILGKNKIDACKIDVEGYELNVLQGCERILSQQHPWLCVEFNTILSGTNKLGNWTVHRYLSELGYQARLFTDAVRSSNQNILSENWTTEGYCNLYYSIS